MIMANLIKRIAISKSRRNGNMSQVTEFASDANKSSSNNTTGLTGGLTGVGRRSPYIELTAKVFSGKQAKESQSGKRTSMTVEDTEPSDRKMSIGPSGMKITKTREITVKSEPNPGYLEGESPGTKKDSHLVVQEVEVNKGKSLDDVSEGESVKSAGRRTMEDSDDEAVLVTHKNAYNWDRTRD